VSDMHKSLDRQNKKVAELESMVVKYQTLCTSSLEQDIDRLEKRKRELVAELEQTDLAILERQQQLHSLRESLLHAAKEKDHSFPVSSDDSARAAVTRSSRQNSNEMALVSDQAVPKQLQNDYAAEVSILADIRSRFSNVLFIVHRNNVEDIVLFQPTDEPSSSSTPNLVAVTKLSGYPGSSQLNDISTLERLMVSLMLLANDDEMIVFRYIC
jgi:hypothetical protein